MEGAVVETGLVNCRNKQINQMESILEFKGSVFGIVLVAVAVGSAAGILH